jgi:squalene-hopene/tetraprenyl-beta-curcumene cyclase
MHSPIVGFVVRCRPALRLAVILFTAAAGAEAHEPTSHYTVKNIEGWKVFVHNDLLPEGKHAETGAAALHRLRGDMIAVKRWVSDEPLEKLLKVGIWLEVDSTNGPHGRTPTFHYHPDMDWLEKMDFHPGKHKCVEYSKAEALAKKKGSSKTLLHELAHAYHDQVLSFDNPDVLAAYTRCVEGTAYPERDWVKSDHKEFFAGVTTRYFGTKEEREGLVQRDPILAELLCDVWGKPKATMDTPLDLVTLATVVDPGPITSDEPIARVFSAENAARYLDTASLHWQKSRNCAACHTNMGYLMARPALSSFLPDSGEVRELFEDYVTTRWKEKPPRNMQDTVVVAAGLAFNDLQTTGKLNPITRQTLQVMWEYQREDGGWTWRNDGYPPTEYDEHYGVTLAALATGIAPDGYAETEEARQGLEKIRVFLRNHPPLSLHHRAMIAWASCYVDGLASDEQRAKTLDELLALQRPDGGWSTPGLLADWEGLQRLDGKPHDTKTSDAYATGFVIVVARDLGMSGAELRRGIDWLLENQRVSGKWFARSPAKDGRQYFSNFGSAFAVLALQSCGELPGWPLSER